MRQLEDQRNQAERAPYKEMADLSLRRDPMIVAAGFGAAGAGAGIGAAASKTTSAWDAPVAQTRAAPVAATRQPSAAPRRPTAQG